MKGEPPLTLPRPSSDDPVELTDWVEACMFIAKRSYVSRSWIRGALRTEVFPDDGEGTDDLSPTELELALETIIAEVNRRRDLCRTSYPFAEGADGGIVFRRRPESVAYFFLLFLSVSPSVRRDAKFRKIDVAFDRVVMIALRGYLGAKSQGIRFGSPRSGARPGKFAPALTWLCDQLKTPRGVGTARKHGGDGGVDVVVWLSFEDRLRAFLAVLAQCTIQRDWYRKARDIWLPTWTAWIDFGFPPATCLAIPFVIAEDDEKLDEARRTATVILDRLRVAELAAYIPDELWFTVLQWLAAEVNALNAA